MITLQEMALIRNTLNRIPVSGEGVVVMADTMRYLDNLISREQDEQKKAENKGVAK